METTQYAVRKVEPKELDEIVKNSGLQIVEADEIKASYLPFLSQLAETQQQAMKIDFDNPSAIDENIARELRLKTVKIRTGAEKLKDDRKKMYLLRGNLEQASYNLIATSCKVTEEVFFQVEKAREIAEKKRKEELKRDREEKLSPYTETVTLYPLGEMTEEQFSELYSALRIAHENRLEAERKAEEERIAKEKAEEAERLRMKAENERLKKEAEEREAKAEAERQRQAKILAEQKRKSDDERRALEAKAEAERQAKVKVEAELKAKKEAEEKARKDAEAKALAEQKAKEAAEKKAKLAPDKEKLLSFAAALRSIQLPEVKSAEASSILSSAVMLIGKIDKYITENANNL